MNEYIGLDDWWATEPFGFDNPDTIQGIKMIIDRNTAPLKEEIEKLKRMVEEGIHWDDMKDDFSYPDG